MRHATVGGELALESFGLAAQEQPAAVEHPQQRRGIGRRVPLVDGVQVEKGNVRRGHRCADRSGDQSGMSAAASASALLACSRLECTLHMNWL